MRHLAMLIIALHTYSGVPIIVWRRGGAATVRCCCVTYLGYLHSTAIAGSILTCLLFIDADFELHLVYMMCVAYLHTFI